MENYFLFLGGPIIGFITLFLLFWLIEEAAQRVNRVLRLIVTMPIAIGFMLAIPLAIIGFGYFALTPLFAGYVIVIVTSIIIVLTKKEKKYPGFL